MKKQRMHCIAVTSLVAMVCLPLLAFASAPQLITYQGRLTDASGDPLNGSFDLNFRIWDAPEGGNQLWHETHNGVPITEGLFSVLLGSVHTPSPELSATIFSDSVRWLGTTVGTGSELTPRVRLTTSGFAFRVATVDGAKGGSIADSLTVAGPIRSTSGGFTFPDGTSQFTQAGASNGLPQAGGTMTGPIESIGDPAIKMGKANFGSNNSNPGLNAIVAGESDTASGDHCVVAGGFGNVASGANTDTGSTVSEFVRSPSSGGGRAGVLSGMGNKATGAESVVAGGLNNEAWGVQSAVVGGRDNIAGGFGSFIGGGGSNLITQSASNGRYSVISGGVLNLVSSKWAVVGGGVSNFVTGQYAVVGGGADNFAGGTHTVVGGGLNDSASADYAAVLGGYNNVALGSYSAIPGGQQNRALGPHAFAAGQRASALHGRTFVWSDGTYNLGLSPFSSTANEQFLIHAAGGVGIGTNSPQEQLDVAGTGRMTGFKMPTGAAAGYVLKSDASGVGTWQASGGGGGGWADDGTNVRLTTITDKVGIGTTTPAEKLDVVGKIRVSGGLTNVTIDDFSVSSNGYLQLKAPAVTFGDGSYTGSQDVQICRTYGSDPGHDAQPALIFAHETGMSSSGNVLGLSTKAFGDNARSTGLLADASSPLAACGISAYGISWNGTSDVQDQAIGIFAKGEGYDGSCPVYGGIFMAGTENNVADHYGIRTLASGAKDNYGGFFMTNSTSPTSTGYGVYSLCAGSGLNYAGYFVGNVNVTGTLSKGGGAFKIDHPLDPKNKYLQHSFVESPDMKNIYDGTVTTEADGKVVVTLPDYFAALNRDFRYQLTVIGQFAQAIIAEEIVNNQFTIETDKPNVKISWQVTGIRKDAWAEKNRIQVEVEKTSTEKGKYLHPEAFGKGEELGVDYEHRKSIEDRPASSLIEKTREQAQSYRNQNK